MGEVPGQAARQQCLPYIGKAQNGCNIRPAANLCRLPA